MFGLHPACPGVVARGARQEIRRHLLGEREMFGILGDAVQIEHELRDAGGPAALADVVPEPWRSLFGNAALENAVRGFQYPGHPCLIARHLRELVKEPRRAGRPMAPAE